MKSIKQISVLVAVAIATLVSAQTDKVAKPERVPRKVSFPIGEVFDLNGTILYPAEPDEAAPVPCVLLLAGSGPTDRNGNQGQIRPRLLSQTAVALADHGIATFRYDKRAFAGYSADFPDLEEMSEFFRFGRFVSDAAAALEFVRTQPGIDPDRIAVLGHSEGGLIALTLATSENPPLGIMCLAAPGRPVAELLREQIAAQIGKTSPDAVEQILASFDAAMDAVKKQEPLPTDLPAWMGSMFNVTTVGIMKDYAEVDPIELARKAKGPVLVLNGSADLQVSAEKDAAVLAEALSSRKDEITTLTILEGISHNFKTVKMPGDPGVSGPVVESALDAIRAWCDQHLVEAED